MWLAFAMMAAHYVVNWGIGGALALALGVEDRREIFRGTAAGFAVIIAGGVAEVWLVLVVGMRRIAGLGFHDVGWRAFAARDIGYGLLGFAVCAAAIVAIIGAELDGIRAGLDYTIARVADYTPQQRVFFALLGVFAVLFEESVFRGILQPTLQQRLGRWSGLLLTTLVFAAYHFAFRLPQFAGKLAIGLTCAALRERTGTVWAPAIAHWLTWAVLGSI